MDSKIASALDKIIALKHKRNYDKAIDKISALLDKHPRELQLQIEALEICLEAGESLKAWQIFKNAAGTSDDCRTELWTFAREKVKSQNDPVLAKLLMEQAIRKRDLESGYLVIENLQNHTAKELLERNRVKKNTLIANMNGDPSLKGDLLINIYSEALLLLRAGSIQEAARTLVHILDEQPAEKDLIEPFLLDCEQSHTNNSALHYALACCALASGQYHGAVTRIGQSLHADDAFLSECVERMERLRESDMHLPEDLDLVLAEARLKRGDSDGAAELLRGVLDSQPERAVVVLEHTSAVTDDPECSEQLRFLHVEAAILAKQYTRAVHQIETMYTHETHRQAVLDWFDEKYRNHLLPSDLLMQYGTIALESGMYEEAAGILNDLADMSPVDVPAICRLLADHENKDDAIEELRSSLSRRFGMTSEGEPDIEHFERTDFHFSDSPDTETDASDFVVEEPALGTEPVISADRDDPFDPGITSSPIALSYDPPTGMERQEPASTAPEQEATNTFDKRYGDFLKGDMDDADIIALIDDAFIHGEEEKLPQLLSFKANGFEDDLRRKLQLTRFHLLQESPLEALSVIKSIDIDTVPDEARKDVLLKLAACYRRVHMYEDAHNTLLRFKSEYPDSPVADRLLKHNYSDYMKQQGCGVELLEKTSELE